MRYITRFFVILLALCAAYTTPVDSRHSLLVGAIRWDGWSDTPIGHETDRALGRRKWRYRLPFFASEVSETEVRTRADSQEVMGSGDRLCPRGRPRLWGLQPQSRRRAEEPRPLSVELA